MRHFKVFFLVGGAGLIWASSAWAQSPYLGNAGGVQGEVGGGTAAGGGSALPFTGFDIGALVVGGLLLVTLGFVLRRATRASGRTQS